MKVFKYGLWILILLVSSCSNDAPVVTDPLAVGGNDDLNPNPVPTPLPNPIPTPGPEPEPITKSFTLQPSDLHKDDTTLVYRSYIKAIGLNEPRDHRKCPDEYNSQCVLNRQVLFQFITHDLNSNYPQELWDVTDIELKADYYSLGKKYRTELLCLLNNKLCTGKAMTKIAGLNIPFIKILWRNPSFWTGRDEDHVVNDWFHGELLKGKVLDDFFVRRDLILNLQRHLNMPTTSIQTLLRKNEGIQFTVTDDTYVENPILSIKLKRRLPDRN